MRPFPFIASSLLALAPIADNSVLIEEAYNQERGVVQHITTVAKLPGAGVWTSTFTQEWPINPAPRHQLSYTLNDVSGSKDPRRGLGDTLVNWRYQVVSDARIAIAPRASLIMPTGDWRRGHGAGGVGADLSFPVSLTTKRRLAVHWNAGLTVVPHARSEAGDRAATMGLRLGQGLIWQAHPRVNGMVEILLSRQQEVVGPDATEWQTSAIVSPGLRWAHDMSSGLQIVPGLAFPVELSGTPSERLGVLLYISFEHPFARQTSR